MGPSLPDSLASLPTLAVDGGAAYCKKIDAWVGDGDSQADAVNCLHKYQFSPQKDQSDLALALNLLAPTRPQTIHAWGFLGGRRDHELLNLGEALAFLASRSVCRIQFYDHEGSIAVDCLGPGEWTIHRHGLFSVISAQDVVLKMTGDCTYPIPQEITLAPLSSFGLSNWGHGDIHLLTQGAIMLLYGEKR
jgi:thiamine pyrophosphokinase